MDEEIHIVEELCAMQTKANKINGVKELMDIYPLQDKLPVLLLYNLDPTWPPEDINESLGSAKILFDALQGEGHLVTEVRLEDQDLPGLLRPYSPSDYIVFNVCEEIPGIPHSYDIIAQTLEELGFTFTGADSKSLSFSEDKRLVKQQLDSCSIPTPRWQVFTSTTSNGWKYFPAIVKPALDHCSFGITRESVVWSRDELASRVSYILDAFNGLALVEEFIDGCEYHVTVVGNGQLHVLPPAEMDFSAFQEARDRLCTYESKHDPKSKAYNLIRLNLPARLSEKDQKSLMEVTLAGYRATACRDYARLDIRRRNGTFYILDINPNADISPDTSPVLAAEYAGLSYGKFGSLLINIAAQRHPAFAPAISEVVVLG
jgi:D-alanine-D-alanine ligase